MACSKSTLPSDWPKPDAAAAALSESLQNRIKQAIEAQSLSFAQYMEMCLYAPGLGYYSAGARKFGEAGDFVTAPEITPLFSRALAISCAAVLAETGGDILELGAGSGVMALELLRALQAMGQLPERYLILERSADLRQRQQALLAEQAPELMSRVAWLDQLPSEPWRGVLLANEVLDALPVERFQVGRDGLRQAYVVERDDAFCEEWRPAGDALANMYERHLADLSLAEGYQSECCVLLESWLAQLHAGLHQGAMIFFDYGSVRTEYYHPSRTAGTLMCHYRHRAHPDPFILQGLQDITAYVDFSAVAELAHAAGLRVAGFTTQAHYLLDVGLDRLLADVEVDGGVEYLKVVQALKQLMLPGEMGERFKAMLLTKNIGVSVPGFRGQDFRSRL